MPELVFIHGRAQEHKDADSLKRQWMDALRQGLRGQGLDMPVEAGSIRFPYYGQTLFDLVSGSAKVAEVLVRGDGDDAETQFLLRVLSEVIRASPPAAAAMEDVGGTEVIDRGPLNNRWVQRALEVIDEFVPGASGASIALATKDVYQYMKNGQFRDRIQSGVLTAFRPGTETVVVSHSLGTVVAYDLICREGTARGWKVPLLVTLGSPLAITAIRDWLRPIRHPEVVGSWFNAYDPDDVVALYPLDKRRWDIRPPVENWGKVDNETGNQHGISGYLEDPMVARRIHDALRA